MKRSVSVIVLSVAAVLMLNGSALAEPCTEPENQQSFPSLKFIKMNAEKVAPEGYPALCFERSLAINGEVQPYEIWGKDAEACLMSSVAADELDECGRDSYEGHIETELSEPEEESAEEKSVTAKYASGASEEKADSATAIAIKGIIAILVLGGGIVIGAKVSKKRM